MPNYKLSVQANEDLIRIYQFVIVKLGQAQADNYLDALFNHFEIIAQRPLAFEAIDHIRPGYRRSVCGIESVFYRVANEIVEIMSIIGRQDMHQIFKE